MTRTKSIPARSRPAASPARSPSPRGGKAGRKTITIPRTTKQKQKGDKPRFSTDMDFIDET